MSCAYGVRVINELSPQALMLRWLATLDWGWQAIFYLLLAFGGRLTWAAAKCLQMAYRND